MEKKINLYYGYGFFQKKPKFPGKKAQIGTQLEILSGKMGLNLILPLWKGKIPTE